MTKGHLKMQADFGGCTYEDSRDKDRLGAQLETVFRIMSDGKWRTLTALAMRAKAPEASVSARLRDMRKAQFGGNTVLRAYVGSGLWRYKLIVKDGSL